MQAFLVSTGLVAIAEIGDKTQLLSLVLAARFRAPWPIMLGITVATLANHALAALLGGAITRWLGPDTLRWILALSFLGMAVWALIPDRLDEDGSRLDAGRSVFVATVIAFFLAEIGDKTQLATVALAAQFPSMLAVVAGTTLGMLLANAPVVLFGERILRHIPMRSIHVLAAATFAALGVWVLLSGR